MINNCLLNRRLDISCSCLDSFFCGCCYFIDQILCRADKFLKQHTAGIAKIQRIIDTIRIPIERQRRDSLSAHNILLAEPAQGRLIQPCAQIQHAGSCVIGFRVVAKAADLHVTHLFAKGGIGEGLHLHADIRQGRGHSLTGNRHGDCLRHRPAPVIDVAGPAVRRECRNAL